MFRYTLVVLTLSLSTLASAQKIPLINSGDALEQGKTAYDSGNYRAAIRAFRSITERDTNYVYMLTELALAYTGDKNYDSALAICTQGLQKPTRHQAHLLKTQAIATDKKGDFAASVVLFEKAIARYPFDYSLIYNLGITYYNHKDHDKAADCFFRTLAINPFHSGSHFNLGRLAIGAGHKTHAAMSLGIFMGINQKDNERLVFLDKLLSNQVEEEGSLTVAFANACERLDQILRAKIAMDKNFKTKVPLDFPVVRQMEMLFEQLPSITTGTDDRWVSLYLPIYKAFKDQNLVEPYIYHILTSVDNEKIKKWLQKNDKPLKAFFTAANTEIARPRYTLTVPESLGYGKPIAATYGDENQLDAIGEADAAGKRNGQWYFFHDNQERAAEGKYAANEKKGLWKYYRDDSSLKSIENYETGETTVYFPEGGKSQHFFLKGEDIDGEVELFHPCGGLREKLVYKAGKRNGPGQSYYPSGKKDLTFEYTDDIATGKFIRYYDNGILLRESEYKKGELNGPYIEYYANGKVKMAGSYIGEQENGVWKYYHANGQPEKTGTFKNGIAIGEWTFYDTDGTVNETRSFTTEGNWQGANDVYYNGKLHYRHAYKNDMLVKYTAFDEQGKERASFGSENGTFTVKNYAANGYLSAEGAYTKGKMQGTWTYYNPDGSRYSEYIYENGKAQGKAAEYFPNGNPRLLMTYKDNNLHGYFQGFYENGQVKQEGWFQYGDRQQRWLRYHANGALESDYFYLNGEVTVKEYDYSAEGKLRLEIDLDDERIRQVKIYNHEGQVESTRRSDGNKDIYETKYASGKLKSQSSVQCGQYTGNTTHWYPDGSIFSEYGLMTGNMHGEYKKFNPGNQLILKGTYLNGHQHGQWTWYLEDGTIESQGKKVLGDTDSTWLYYNRDGKLSSRVRFKGDERDGIAQYYAPDGTTLLLEEQWENGKLVAYRAATNGQAGEWQKFKAETHISATFPNGGKGLEEHYVKGMQDGARRFYYASGTLYSEYNYKNGDKNGPYKVNYASGKVREKGEYKDDEFTGIRETYLEDGTLLRSETFVHGSKEGKSIWYKNGKKVSEVAFYGNDPEK